MKLICMSCGYITNSKYEHKVCPKCKGSMHYKNETSYLKAIADKDRRTIKKIEDRAKKGEIVRII